MVEIIALGVPAPQGSKRHVGNGIMIEASKRLRPWRESVRVQTAAQLAALSRWEPLDGALSAWVCFTLPRPKTAPRARHWPDRMPDLSKLIRAVEDSFSDAGLWVDDARVVQYWRLAKLYVGDSDADALAEPGVYARVWRTAASETGLSAPLSRQIAAAVRSAGVAA